VWEWVFLPYICIAQNENDGRVFGEQFQIW